MKKKFYWGKAFRKMISLAVAAIFLFVSGIPASFAIDLIDLNQKCTLNLEYHYYKTDIENVRFYLYKVADTTDQANFTLCDDFKKYSKVKGLDNLENLNNLTSDEWTDLASLLDDYVGVKYKNSPDYEYTGKTSAEGKLTISDIEPGLYLLTGASVKLGKRKFIPTPVLMSIPTRENGSESWTYDITVNVKMVTISESDGGDPTPDPDPDPDPDPTPPDPSPDPTPDPDDTPDSNVQKLNVVKVWKDEGHEKDRPESVKVQLLRNATGEKEKEVVEEVELNEKNNWRYSWDNLSTEYEWSAVEAVTADDTELEAYHISRSKQDSTSSAASESTSGTTSTATDSTAGTATSSAAGTSESNGEKVTTITLTNEYVDVPDGNTNTTTDTTKKTNSKLPQTGLTWWPVPVLALAGICFIILGLARRRNASTEDEEDMPEKDS